MTAHKIDLTDDQLKALLDGGSHLVVVRDGNRVGFRIVQDQDEILHLTGELRIAKHELSLIEASTQRGITDCSTPLHIRVQNIVEQLERAEKARDEWKASAQHVGQDLAEDYITVRSLRLQLAECEQRRRSHE